MTFDPHPLQVHRPDAAPELLTGVAVTGPHADTAQAVEHYEITRYGTLIAFARQLGRADCAAVLEENLAEEKATDKKLTEIAESKVNRMAA